MKKQRTKLSRRLDSKVLYRGEKRPVWVEIDRTKGTIAVRLHGCSTRRIYAAVDLWKNPVPQLLFPL